MAYSLAAFVNTAISALAPPLKGLVANQFDFIADEGTSAELRATEGNLSLAMLLVLALVADDPWVLNSGYFGMGDKTAEAWRNGWFHTGDGFVRDADGWFTFVDRKKDAIRRRGEHLVDGGRVAG